MLVILALFHLVIAGALPVQTASKPVVSRADAEQRIARHLAANQFDRAIQTYDSYVETAKKPDIGLLRMLAAAELDRSSTPAASPMIRLQALAYQARSGDAKALDTLRKASATEPGFDATLVLVELKDTGAATRLASLLDGAPADVKPRIIKALQDADARSEAARLLPLLDSPDVPVRTAAALAIGALQYHAAAERLRVMLAGDPVMRMTAAIALRRLGDESLDAQVAPLLGGILPEVRLMAVEGYGPSGSRRWVAGIKELGTDRNESIRVRAAELLACCDAPSARAILIASLDSQIPSVQSQAARVLARSGLTDARLARRMLGNALAEVRVHGAGATMKLADPAQR